MKENFCCRKLQFLDNLIVGLFLFLLPENVDDPVFASVDEIEEYDILGVDLGIKELGITSDEETLRTENIKNNLKKLKRNINVEFLEKLKEVRIEKKAITRLSKVHKRVADIRNNTVHKLTTSLVKAKPKMIVIETLKKNMSKNHKLAKCCS